MSTSASFQQAKQYHTEQKLDQAHQAYCNIIAQDPYHLGALHGLGVLHAQKKDYQLAIDFLNRCLALKPHEPTFLKDQARMYLANNQPTKATDNYHTLQTHHPSPHTHLYLASCYAHKPEKALNHLRQGLPNTAYILPIAKHLKQHFSAPLAYRWLRFQIHRHPLQLDWINQLGAWYQDSDQYQAAKLLYEQALTNHPKQAGHFWHLLGGLYAQEKQYLPATEAYQTSLQHRPDHPETHHNLCILYLQTNQPQSALSHGQQALLKQKDPDTLYNVGLAYLKLNRHQDAKHYFTEVTKSQPQSSRPLVNLGVIAMRAQQPVQAIDYFKQALKLDAHQPSVQYLLDALQGHTTAHQGAPTEYVAQLFDDYAAKFDDHLAMLNYCAPQKIYDILTEHIDHRQIAIDLGCGTGQLADKIYPLFDQLIGVDVSDNMLQQAAKKNRYQQLFTESIDTFLARKIQADAYLACDVFPYMGDLLPWLKAIAPCLKQQGLLIFTTETETQANTYQLQPTGRFTHPAQQIKDWIQLAGLNCLSVTASETRKQAGVWIKSTVFVVKR